MSVRTLNELLLRAVREHDRPDAFLSKREGRWHPVSHREFAELVEDVAAGLLDLGAAPGDRVGLLSENRLEWAACDYAILAAGAVTVPIYATLPSNQIEYILNDCEARVLFVSNAGHRATALDVRARLRPDLVIVSFDAAGDGVPGVLSLDALRERGRRRRAAHPDELPARRSAVRAEELASIIYTSGTTGLPKGVMLSHGNIVSNVLAALSVFPIGPTDSCLSFLPLCHIFERMAGHFTMMHAGASVAYAESMDTVPDNLAEVRPTLLISVPRLYEKMHARVLDAIAKAPPIRQKLFAWAMDVGRRRSRLLLSGRPVPGGLAFQFRLASRLVFSKLKGRLGGRIRFMVSGGAPLSPDIAEFFHAADVLILEGYGLTETSPVISANRLGAMRIGTVGQPFPGVEVRLADDGEILVKSPGVMLGYYRLPEATAEALQDGWFHTGDIGRIDPGGFLTITDRKKDLIVTAGGKNVAPQPLEYRLKQDPLVAEAVVIGDRRPYCVALLVPDFAKLEAWASANGVPTERPALLADPRVTQLFLERLEPMNRDLAPFERIKRVGLIDRELTVAGGELTPTLKVKRRVVVERFRPLIEELYRGHVPTPG
jgi:long-chain acyl-CoA synthetase